MKMNLKSIVKMKLSKKRKLNKRKLKSGTYSLYFRKLKTFTNWLKKTQRVQIFTRFVKKFCSYSKVWGSTIDGCQDKMGKLSKNVVSYLLNGTIFFNYDLKGLSKIIINKQKIMQHNHIVLENVWYSNKII